MLFCAHFHAAIVIFTAATLLELSSGYLLNSLTKPKERSSSSILGCCYVRFL
jgi:hypothetical protein